jgi:hypothetical protein
MLGKIMSATEAAMRTALVVVLIGLFGMTGCQSVKYRALEPFGIES